MVAPLLLSQRCPDSRGVSTEKVLASNWLLVGSLFKIFQVCDEQPIVQWYNDYTILNIGSWLHVVPSHYGLDCFSISIIFRDLRTSNRWWLEISNTNYGPQRPGHHLRGR